MAAFHRLVRFLHHLEDAVLVSLLLALLGLAVAQIIMRNVFDGGWLWADNAVRVLLLWVALWGANVAARNGRHIRIEIASHYFPKSWQPVMLAFCDFICALISGVVAWHSALFVLDEKSYGEMAFLNVPVWVCELVIPLAFAILAVRFLGQALFTALRREAVLE